MNDEEIECCCYLNEREAIGWKAENEYIIAQALTFQTKLNVNTQETSELALWIGMIKK